MAVRHAVPTWDDEHLDGTPAAPTFSPSEGSGTVPHSWGPDRELGTACTLCLALDAGPPQLQQHRGPHESRCRI